MHQRILVILFLGITLIPFFSLLDLVAFPEYFRTFLFYRLVCAMIYGLMLMFHLSPYGKGHPFPLAVLIYTPAAALISLMLVGMGSDASFYYPGLILVLTTGSMIMPLTTLQSIAVGLMVYLIYVIPEMIFSVPSGQALKVFYINNFFFFSFMIITVVQCWNETQLRIRKFNLKLQLEYSAQNLEDEVEKRAKKLEESEIRYRELYENIVDMVILVNRNGRVIMANPRFYSLIGFDEGQAEGISLIDYIHPDDYEKVQEQIFKKLPHMENIKDFEFRLINVLEDVFDVECNANQITKENKNVGFQMVIRDITRRKRAEKALYESNARFEILTSQLSDVLWISTADGTKVLDLNHAFEKVFGVSNSEFYLNPGLWLEMVHPEDRKIAEDSHEELLRVGQAQAEYRIVRPDGEVRWIQDRKALFYDEDHQSVKIGGIGSDITSIKKKEMEEEKLQAQLFQAQKMEAVGRLAGGVAHDYNNMLCVIIGFTDLALSKVDPNAPIHGDLLEILSAAKRSADITRQLLAFSRQQTVTPKRIDLNTAVKDILSMIEQLIGENINLTWLPGAETGTINIDPSQIDQILTNLCVNARDAISDIGRITIVTKNVAFDDVYCVAHEGFVPGEYVMLSITDDGCGMDKETLNQIFEPFFTTKKVGQGTGLGLATVYGIVKQNNGFINVFSEPGEGTSYHIYLPRHMGHAHKVQKKPPIANQQGNGETILVVEDEASILKLAKNILEKIGYIVLTASSPDEAIRLAMEHTDDIHLLFTDVVMPEMNGKDLAGQMQSIYPDIKCLFMSGYTDDVIAHRGILAEDEHFIQKPFSRKELTAKIRATLDGVFHDMPMSEEHC